MKNAKKLPTKQLEKFSNIFTQLGLVLILFIVFVTLEHKTEQKQITIMEYEVPEKIFIAQDQEIIFQKEPEPKPKLETPKNTVFLADEPIKKADNTTEETQIIIDPIVDEVPFDINTIVVVKVPNDEEPIETVPFIFIENTPVFEGCEGLSEEENKKCFHKKMQQFIRRNFDTDLANKLGLHSGKHKILTQFIINDKGNVINIKIRAPHNTLENETQKLIEKLPKFTPGKQRNKAVKVKYSLPITFLVD